MDYQGGFRIGPWTVSPLTGEIESGGTSVHLEPKVMEVLVVLAEKAKTVVLREQLLDRIWGPRAAISDEPLTRCIAQLRQSLGDSSRDPKFIQTVPKRGYRLLVPALPIDDAPQAVPPVAARPQQPVHERTWSFRPWQGIVLIGVLAIAGLIASGTFLLVPDPDVDPCFYDQSQESVGNIDAEAVRLCRQGIVELNQRSAESIRYAIDYFRMALDREPAYGSAIVNLARAFVLLPTYEEEFPEENCWIDEASRFADCYEAAISLFRRARMSAGYIEPYLYGIEGYVFTKQRRWLEAQGAFGFAVETTKTDPDMWQWYSQFLTSVGNLDGALDAIAQAYRLDRQSPVILDRYGVILMWLDRNDESEERFRQSEAIPHAAYAESQLVREIRQQRWDVAEQKLLDFSNARRNADTDWASVFIDALRNPEDAVLHARAVEAVELAIEKRYLTGQLEYGAWVYLGEAERAFNAAERLLEVNPQALDVEFLFASETGVLRDFDRFGEILEELQLVSFWSDPRTRCPEIFHSYDWCE